MRKIIVIGPSEDEESLKKKPVQSEPDELKIIKDSLQQFITNESKKDDMLLSMMKSLLHENAELKKIIYENNSEIKRLDNLVYESIAKTTELTQSMKNKTLVIRKKENKNA